MSASGRAPFSVRTRFTLGENRIALASRGRTFLDLTETNPTRVGLPPVPADLLAALSSPAVATYSPEAFGLRAAREAVARAYGLDADRLVLSTSTSEAYGWIFKLLCDPGDRVLVPRPSYPLLDWLAALEGVTLDGFPTLAHDDWHIDFDALQAAITDRTRAICVVSPNNPTGAVLRSYELVRLAAICRQAGLALIVDQVFAEWIAQPSPDHARTSDHDGCLTFTLDGLSKSALLPQLKLAWTSVSGPAGEVAEALARLELVADSYLSVSTPVQVAAAEILARRAQLQAPLRERLRVNEASLARLVAGSPASLLPRAAGWCAVLALPRSRSEEEWVLAGLDAGVLVHPGHFFDFEREAYAVVSLLVEEERFAEGVRRFLGVLEKG